MSLIATALVATTTDTLTLGPITWKIRRITTHELVASGGKVLLAIRRAGESAPPPSPTDTGPLQFAFAVLAAGVVAASVDGGKTWEDLRIVFSQAEEDPAAGRVWAGSLTRDHRDALGQAITRLSNDGGSAEAQLARFLGGQPGCAGSGGEAVRDGSGVGHPLDPVPAVPGV